MYNKMCVMYNWPVRDSRIKSKKKISKVTKTLSPQVGRFLISVAVFHFHSPKLQLETHSKVSK